MAKEINTQSITFNPAAKTIDFSAWTSFDIRKLVSIVNDSRNAVIYLLGDDTGVGLASIAGNVITLQFNTTSHNAADKLSIIYDEEQAATKTLQTAGNSSLSSIDGKLPALSGGKVPVDSNCLTDTQLRASAVPVSGTFFQATQPISASSLPLPTDAATSSLQTLGNASLSSLDAKLPAQGAALISASLPINIASDQMLSTSPVSSQAAIPTRAVPAPITRTTFASTISNGVDTEFWQLMTAGTGMTINQTSGNLVITAGTTKNSETVIRSNQFFTGTPLLRWSTILSQRNANNNFFVELVDIIGDNLAYTINSATSITITLPSNSFTAANIGQSMWLQNIVGTADAIPGKYIISAISGDDITFTVAGFPVSGTGTLSLVGWNYVLAKYTGTTATTLVIESQRKGYASNSTHSATINTTATGHLADISLEGNQISMFDSLQTTSSSINMSRRSEIVQSIPPDDIKLYLQIRVLNATSAPTATTWTLGLVSIVSRSIQNFAINSIANLSGNSPLPVNLNNTSLVVAGNVAHSSAASGNPVRIGGKASNTIDSAIANNDVVDLPCSTGNQVIVKPYAVSENDWQYTGTLTTATATAMTAAGAASVRNYITALNYQNSSATATTIIVLDGSTTLNTFYAPALMAAPAVIPFPTPMKGTAATALNINCGTAGANVYVNAQGYKSL